MPMWKERWMIIYHGYYYHCGVCNHHHSRKHRKVCNDLFRVGWHNFIWWSERPTCFFMTLNIKSDLNTEETNPMILSIWAGPPQKTLRILTLKIKCILINFSLFTASNSRDCIIVLSFEYCVKRYQILMGNSISEILHSNALQH